ncbi:MAG: MMPL family transporter [Micromonosporaceae bacterium]
MSYGGIISHMPLFMFVLLFGLSMDYHVFILSRIRELRVRDGTTASGISGSAGVVTSAAMINVAMFSIFATLSVIDFKFVRYRQCSSTPPSSAASCCPPR